MREAATVRLTTPCRGRSLLCASARCRTAVCSLLIWSIQSLPGIERRNIRPSVIRWQAERKARQFCRQVERALNLALADRHEDDCLCDLFVEDVSPAPDCGHLLVHVVIPADWPVSKALGALRHDAPRLRSEIAMAITRKRAPELSFVPAFPHGREDE